MDDNKREERAEMIAMLFHVAQRWAFAVMACACMAVVSIGWTAQNAGAEEYGLAAKRPVVQASCKHCPWGQLAEILKKMMAPAYDIAICYGCSGENSAR